MDDALVAIESDPAVLYHLLPCPLKQVPGPPRPGDKRKSGDDLDGEKGKGKGKGKGSKAPAAIKDLNHNTDAGKRICWNYNLKNKGCKFAKTVESCKRGVHCCMVCFGSHPQFDCKGTFFLARCCLGQVPGGAPFSQRSEQATACTNRMQIRN